VVLVAAFLVMLALSFLGLALFSLSVAEHTMAYNSLWAEGAFAAAEAGINSGVNQLSPNTTSSVQPIPTTSIATAYTFRSGRRADPGPQPLGFAGSRLEAGYTIAIGTGYNPSGYTFHAYQINATGQGPRSAQREVEVLAEYGPVSE
jgi:Tfp pilus assembly protein PilX